MPRLQTTAAQRARLHGPTSSFVQTRRACGRRTTLAPEPRAERRHPATHHWHGRARTSDHPVNSRALYLLSYMPRSPRDRLSYRGERASWVPWGRTTISWVRARRPAFRRGPIVGTPAVTVRRNGRKGPSLSTSPENGGFVTPPRMVEPNRLLAACYGARRHPNRGQVGRPCAWWARPPTAVPRAVSSTPRRPAPSRAAGLSIAALAVLLSTSNPH